jgi:hypothetical protein
MQLCASRARSSYNGGALLTRLRSGAAIALLGDVRSMLHLMADLLNRHREKRDFAVTAEPRGKTVKPGRSLSFVVQKHAASRLHYDFRLELEGMLKPSRPSSPTLVDRAPPGDDRIDEIKFDGYRLLARIEARPDEILQNACRLKLEGVIGKRRDSLYVSRRSPHGLRSDKPAAAITKETPLPVKAVAKAATKATPAASRRRAAAADAPPEVPEVPALPKDLRITHPERVIDTSTGLTKQDLVDHYLRVAKRMLPHLHKRPVALVRAPSGIAHQLFFQKHAESLKIPNWA